MTECFQVNRLLVVRDRRKRKPHPSPPPPLRLERGREYRDTPNSWLTSECVLMLLCPQDKQLIGMETKGEKTKHSSFEGVRGK